MRRLRGFKRRFRLPWRPIHEIRRDIDDELAFHLDEAFAALKRQGLSADEAREEAFRRFGDLETARRRLIDDDRVGERNAKWRYVLDSLLRDTGHALRSLRRSPAFTVTAVVVLALGIGIVTTMFSIVNIFALKPMYADNPDELVAVYSRNLETPDRYRGFSYAEFDELRAENDAFVSLAAWQFDVAGVEQRGITKRLPTGFVSAGYFDTLGVPPASGRAFTRAEERGEEAATAVVSHDFWVRNGRDPGVLGSTLRMNGQQVVVVGVAPEHFTGTVKLLSADVWVPLAFIEHVHDGRQRRLMDPGFASLYVFGRKRADVPVDPELAARAASNDANLPAEDGSRFTYVATPMPQLTIATRPEDDDGIGSGFIVLLMAMGAVVLLTACLNLANTFFARGVSRRTEMAIRQSLGSGRARLIRQLLTEGLLLSIAGGAIGLVAAYWLVQGLAASLATAIPQGMTITVDARPDVRVILVTVVACVVATLLFGLGPSWRVTGRHLATSLKRSSSGDAFAGGGSATRLLAPRNSLIVAQIALSLVMLTAGGLFARAAIIASGTTPGFSLESSLLVELDAALAGYDEMQARDRYRRVVERLRALPEVENAALTTQVPFSGITHDIAGVEPVGGSGDETPPTAYRYVVSEGYFDTVRLPLLRGRDFTVAETASRDDSRVAIVDERFAERLFGDSNALGRHIRFPSDGDSRESQPVEIVGIVPATLQELGQTGFHVYVPSGREFRPNRYVHLRVGENVPNPQALLEIVGNEIRSIDPALPVLKLMTLRTFVDGNFNLWFVRAGGIVFTWLGIASLFMVLVGVYGVTAFLISRRTREIGLRMALGATRGTVTRELMRDGARTTLAGVAVGVVLAVAAARLLGSMLYEVSALDPLVFGAATVFLAAAAMLASYLPMRYASRAEPTTMLRHE